MTYHPRDPWISYAELLEMPLGDRVKYVRGNLAPSVAGSNRRAIGMNQDEFAEAIGASSGRHAVIPWESGEREPREFADKIADLTPYPQDAFRKTLTRDEEIHALRAEVAELNGAVKDLVHLLVAERSA